MHHAAEENKVNLNWWSQEKKSLFPSISLCWQSVPAQGIGVIEASLLLQSECMGTAGGLGSDALLMGLNFNFQSMPLSCYPPKKRARPLKPSPPQTKSYTVEWLRTVCDAAEVIEVTAILRTPELKSILIVVSYCDSWSYLSYGEAWQPHPVFLCIPRAWV